MKLWYLWHLWLLKFNLIIWLNLIIDKPFSLIMFFFLHCLWLNTRIQWKQNQFNCFFIDTLNSHTNKSPIGWIWRDVIWSAKLNWSMLINKVLLSWFFCQMSILDFHWKSIARFLNFVNVFKEWVIWNQKSYNWFWFLFFQNYEIESIIIFL